MLSGATASVWSVLARGPGTVNKQINVSIEMYRKKKDIRRLNSLASEAIFVFARSVCSAEHCAKRVVGIIWAELECSE